MLLLGVLVIPDNRASALLNYRSIDVFTVLAHELPYGCHPLLILDFEQFAPVLFVCHEPVSAFRGDPKVLLLHQV